MHNESNQRALRGLSIVVVVAILCALFLRMYVRGTDLDVVATQVPPDVVCTKEAKICLDGSSVGRVGPQCEFAPCAASVETEASSTPNPRPIGSDTTTTVTQMLSLNQRVTVGGVTLMPTVLLEDSRCPIDVQCIQAGTVRITAQIKDAQSTDIVTLTLGKAMQFRGTIIAFTSVTPAKKFNSSTATSTYQFTFTITPAAVSTDINVGTLKGKVTLGPVCPVERQDDPCVPTLEQYTAQKFLIYKTDQKIKSQVVVPDATGTFNLELPVGDYVISRAQGDVGPGGATGVPATVTIYKGVITEIAIDIDTGIR